MAKAETRERNITLPTGNNVRFLRKGLVPAVKAMFTLAAASMISALAGCGSLNEESRQTIVVRTPNAPGALCVLSSEAIGSWTLVTPASIRLMRGAANILVHCSRECFEDADGQIVSRADLGENDAKLVLGGPVGTALDAATGTLFKYDYDNIIKMKASKCASSRQASQRERSAGQPINIDAERSSQLRN